MKKLLYVLLWAAGAAGVCGQQTAPTTAVNSSISLDVRVLSSGGVASSSGGPFNTKVRDSSTLLEMRARNLSTQAEKATFQWLFFARGVSQGAAYLFDSGSTELLISPGAELSHKIHSQPIVQSTTVQQRQTSGEESRRSTYSVVSRQGSRPSGWVLRVFSDGKLVRVKASSSEYEKLGYTYPYNAPASSTPPPAPPTFRGLD